MDNLEENKKLSEEIESKNLQIQELVLINSKLGYSTKLMSEFHMSLEDKEYVANEIDACNSLQEVDSKYLSIKKQFKDKNLPEEFEDFQMSPNFKKDLINYLSVSKGYNPVLEMSEKLGIIRDYFSFENKIRSTPDARIRQSMTDKLLLQRPDAINAINRTIDILNELK